MTEKEVMCILKHRDKWSPTWTKWLQIPERIFKNFVGKTILIFFFWGNVITKIYFSQIDTGSDCFIHLQLKISTNPNERDPTLQACEGCKRAQSPLIQLNITSMENRCQPATIRAEFASSANKLSRCHLLQLQVFMIMGYLFRILNM